MGIAGILASIDEQIAILKQARTLLTAEPKRGRGRPKTVATVVKPVKRKPYKISPEGRKRIVAAVKRRWAAQKKAGK